MGDGRVALVLDVLGLAQRSSVVSGAKNRSLSEQEQTARPPEDAGQSLLFFEPREGGQMAIPLALVARLEEFPRKMLENLGARQVVQYRGEILPLVDVSEELEHLRLGGQRPVAQRPTIHRNISPEDELEASGETIPVVVCADANQRVGLMVGKILDIVHDQISARSRANRPGVLFTAVVQEKVTEFVDVAALVREATTDLLQPPM